jgi:16S rRNA C967 or C1407 C5-methylase (RsmB/RsmF family)
LNQKFEDYFSDIYKERWPLLKEAMLLKPKKVLRPINTENYENLDQLLSRLDLLDDHNRDQLQEKVEGKKKYYALDAGSIYAASLLKVPSNAKVLDMCSAPGGKALILRELMGAEANELIVNEPSQNRRERLKNVLREHLTEDQLECLTVKGIDGMKYGLQFEDYFDAILIDAPCSGEKHLLETPSELERWTPKRTKRLAGQQYGLVCSGLLALKSGGSLVYSTCSISPKENDEIIEKLLTKKSDQFKLDLPDDIPSFMERTKYGIIALPDHGGHGPLFCTRLEKL